MASDNFNRADGGLGANWDSFGEGTGTVPTISSNQAIGHVTVGSSAESFALWDAPFDADQFSEAAVGTNALGTNSYEGVIVRASDQNHYYLLIYFRTGSASWSLLLFVKTASLTYSQIGSVTLGGALAQGDVIRLEAEGSTIRGLLNGAATGISVTDTTYAGGGQAGISLYGGTGPETTALDNWAGGDLHPAVAFIPRIVEYA